jgi:hypothetical protein
VKKEKEKERVKQADTSLQLDQSYTSMSSSITPQKKDSISSGATMFSSS